MAEANTQYPDLPLPLGIDTATQPELVPIDKALSIRNCHVGNGALVERRNFTRLGRGAYTEATGSINHGEVKAILPLGDGVMIATEESKLFKRHETNGPWVELQCNDSPVSFKQALHSGPARNGSIGERVRNPNCAVLGDFLCVTWWQAEGVEEGEEASVRATGVALIYNLATKVVHHIKRLVDTSAGLAGELGCTSGGGNGSNPSLIPVAVGSRFFVLWIDGNANQIQYRSIDPATCYSTDWSGTSVFATQAAPDTFDAFSDATTLYVAHNSTTHVVLRRATAAGAVLTVTHSVNQAADDAFAIAVSKSTARVLVAWTNATGEIWASASMPADASTASNGAATKIGDAGSVQTNQYQQITCLSSTDGSTHAGFIAWCSGPPGSPTTAYDFPQFVTTTRRVPLNNLTSFGPMDSDGIQQHEHRGVSISHRPFRRSATAYGGLATFVGMRRSQQNDCAYYTYSAGVEPALSASIGRTVTPVARYSPLVASMPFGTDETVVVLEAGVSAVVEHGGRYHWVGVERVPMYDVGAGPTGNPADGLGVTRDTLHVYSLDYSSDRSWSHVVVNGQTMVAGSIPRIVQPELVAVDDETLARGMIGTVPLHAPPPADIVSGGGGGNLDDGAVYHYRFTYEHVDMQGRVHRGAPSADQSFDLAPGETTIEVGFSNHAAPQPGYRAVKLVLWRTEGNPPELIYYRLAEIDPGATQYIDEISDASLVNNPTLYTDSGELDNFPPPPSLALCLWKNRIIALDSETGALWPSKTLIDGEWPGFHEGLAVATNVHKSLPVFISEDTDNLIVWWRDAIGVTYGDPGSDTGAPGSMTQPRLLPQRGIGLKYVKSLVRTEIGHMFMSDRGFYLLGPDMGLQYIGEPVSAYESHVIVGAYVVKTPKGSTEVRFETQGADEYNDGYVALVYDLVKQAWHVHTRGRMPGAAAVINNRLYLATRAGGTDDPWANDQLPDVSGVWLESTSTVVPEDVATDPSGIFQTVLDMAWLAFAGKLGTVKARRLWVFGDLDATSRDVSLSVYYDYDAGTVVHGPSSIGIENPVGTGRRTEFSFAQQDCGAIRLQLRAFQRLIAMRLEVEAERGAWRRNNNVVG